MAEIHDLEIQLSRGEKGMYTADLRYTQPGDADTQTARGSATVEFPILPTDLTGMKDGERLLKALFANQPISALYQGVRSAVAAENALLRIRLVVDRSAIELDAVNWEVVADPLGSGRLTGSQAVLFSRFVSQPDWAPARLGSRGRLKALLVASFPDALSKGSLTGESGAAPVDITAEVQRARLALQELALENLEVCQSLPEKPGFASYIQVTEKLSAGVDVLYLAGYLGFRAQNYQNSPAPSIAFEGENGQAELVPAPVFAQFVGRLPAGARPRLVVISVPAMTTRDSATENLGEGLIQTGRLLLEAGVQAVLTLRAGSQTGLEDPFLQVFFREMRQDGMVDRAAAVARSASSDVQYGIVPTLMMRTRSGKIWYEPGFSEADNQLLWGTVIDSIAENQAALVLGPELYANAFGTPASIAGRLISHYHLETALTAPNVLEKAVHEIALDQGREAAEDALLRACQDEFRRILGDALANSVALEPQEMASAAVASAGTQSPYSMLAGLPVSIYINASPLDLITPALQAAGKQPVTMTCAWNEQTLALQAPAEADASYVPSPVRPLVFQLYGSLHQSGSLVLTEEDYNDVAVEVLASPKNLPAAISRALVGSNLVILGFDGDDLGLITLLRIASKLDKGNRRKPDTGFVQLPVFAEETSAEDRARRRVETSLQRFGLRVYWGSPEDLAGDLIQRWEAQLESAEESSKKAKPTGRSAQKGLPRTKTAQAHVDQAETPGVVSEFDHVGSWTGIDITDVVLPEEILANMPFTALVKARNTGSLAWPKGETLLLSTLFTTTGEKVDVVETRHKLFSEVPPGEISELEVDLDLPEAIQSGRCITNWTLSLAGSPTIKAEHRAELAIRAPEIRPSIDTAQNQPAAKEPPVEQALPSSAQDLPAQRIPAGGSPIEQTGAYASRTGPLPESLSQQTVIAPYQSSPEIVDPEAGVNSLIDRASNASSLADAITALAEAQDLAGQAARQDLLGMILLNYGTAYAKWNETGKSVEYFQQAITQLRNSGANAVLHAQALFEQGMAYRELGNFDQAINAFRQSLNLAPDQNTTSVELGRTLMMTGQLDEARRTLDTARQRSRSDVEVNLALGDICRAQGDFEGAEKAYQAAIRLSPRYPAGYHGLAGLYLEFSEFDKAQAAYGRAVEKIPDSLDLRHALALFYYSRGQLELAKTEIDTALERPGLEQDGQGRLNLELLGADLDLEQGRYGEAATRRESVLALRQELDQDGLEGGLLSHTWALCDAFTSGLSQGSQDYWREGRSQADQRMLRQIQPGDYLALVQPGQKLLAGLARVVAKSAATASLGTRVRRLELVYRVEQVFSTPIQLEPLEVVSPAVRETLAEPGLKPFSAVQAQALRERIRLFGPAMPDDQLPPAALLPMMRFRLQFQPPEHFTPGKAEPVELQFVNTGFTTWEAQVEFTLRSSWRMPAEATLADRSQAQQQLQSMLPVAPGESFRQPISLQPPDRAGAYTIVLDAESANYIEASQPAQVNVLVGEGDLSQLETAVSQVADTIQPRAEPETSAREPVIDTRQNDALETMAEKQPPIIDQPDARTEQPEVDPAFNSGHQPEPEKEPDQRVVEEAPFEPLPFVSGLAYAGLLQEIPISEFPILALAMRPDGKQAAAASANGLTSLCNLVSGAVGPDFKLQQGRPADLVYNPSGQAVAIASEDGTAWIWSTWQTDAFGLLFSPAKMDQQINALEGRVHSVDFSPDGRLLVLVEDGGVQVWDVLARRVLRQVEGHFAFARFRPGSSLNELALGLQNGEVQLWEADRLELLRTLARTSGGPAAHLAFSPGGERLAVLDGADSCVWDVESSALLLTFKGHTRALHSVVFSPDGRGLLTASADGTARLWDAQTGRELLRLQVQSGMGSPMRRAVFSPDGLQAAAGGDDGVLRLWDLRVEGLWPPGAPPRVVARRVPEEPARPAGRQPQKVLEPLSVPEKPRDEGGAALALEEPAFQAPLTAAAGEEAAHDEDQLRAIQVSQHIAWINLQSSVQRSLEDVPVSVLDIHVRRDVESTLGEAAQAVAPGIEAAAAQRGYWVLMTLSKKDANGAFPERYYEGPFNMQAFSKYLPAERGDDEYGAALHTAMFHRDLPGDKLRLTQGGQPTLLDGYLAALDGNRHPLHVQLRIDTRAEELHSLQWEYLFDKLQGTLGEPMACSQHTPFARYLQVANRAVSQPPEIDEQRKLRLLLVMASPDALAQPGGVRSRGLNASLQGLAPFDRSLVDQLAKSLSGSAIIEPLAGANLLVSAPGQVVSLNTLHDRLQQAEDEGRPVQALHMICHGLPAGPNGASLVLENERGEPVLVPEDEFCTVLRRFAEKENGLRLVVLSSCYTAQARRGSPFGGVARRLVANGGLPAVVAMQHALQFESAQLFAERLYLQLLHHGEIDRAVNAARLELWLSRDRFMDLRDDRVRSDEWGIPVLFSLLPDGRLFDVPEPARRLVDPDRPLAPQPLDTSPELLQSFARAGVVPMGMLPGLNMQSLAQAIGQAMRPAAPDSTGGRGPSRPRLFGLPGDEARRNGLLQAAWDYRTHPARPLVLLLRRRALSAIAGSVSPEALENGSPACLDEPTFRDQLWMGGQVFDWQGHCIAADLVGPGPVGDGLRDENNQKVETACGEWWAAWREERRDEAGQLLPPPRITGNLVWPADAALRPYPPNINLDQVRDQLKLLLYQSGDRRQAYQRVLQNPPAGVDHPLASLLLQAVYPDDFVPFSPALARDALAALHNPPGYRAEFDSFQSLAHDLLGDPELGLRDLADCAYFLQRLAYGRHRIVERPAPPIQLNKVSLRRERIDSRLVLRPGLLDQASAALNSAKHIILIGPPGTGKTTLAEDLCRHAHDLGCAAGYRLITATADWTTFDTVGGYMPDDSGKLVFRPGIILETIRQRRWLVIDEINRADIDKAFGELFTVLSGQAVTLPYHIDGRPVRILPPGSPASTHPADFVIDPGWRIIGTMNVYDKTSLFAMSYAFMRRFAFVDVPIPENGFYQSLIRRFLARQKLLASTAPGQPLDPVLEMLLALFRWDAAHPDDHPLMQYRAMGPAIAEDVVEYLAERCGRDPAQLVRAHLIEALLLYMLPQFDGLEKGAIEKIYRCLNESFTEPEGDALLERIRDMFPFIAAWEARSQPRPPAGP